GEVTVTALPGAEALSGRRTEVADREQRPLGVVVCSPGDGFSAAFAAAGAEVVRSSPGARASTGQLLSAVLAVGARSVLVLPNDPDTVLAAEAAAGAARTEGIEVTVVPSAAAVQGLAALAVWDPQRAFSENYEAMLEVVRSTRHGAVTRASRDSGTPAGPCRAGQPLGMVAGRITVVAEQMAQAARQVLAQICPEGTELLTVARGAGGEEGELDPVLEE